MKTFNFLKNLGLTKIALSQRVRLSIMRIGTAFLLGLSLSPQAMAYERIFEIALDPLKQSFNEINQLNSQPVFQKLNLNETQAGLTEVDRIIQASLALYDDSLPQMAQLQALIEANVYDDRELEMIKNLKSLYSELLKLRYQIIAATPVMTAELALKNIEIGKIEEKLSSTWFYADSLAKELDRLKAESSTIRSSMSIERGLKAAVEHRIIGVLNALSLYRGIGIGRQSRDELDGAEFGVSHLFHDDHKPTHTLHDHPLPSEDFRKSEEK